MRPRSSSRPPRSRIAGLGLTERVMARRMKKYGIRYRDFRPGRG